MNTENTTNFNYPSLRKWSHKEDYLLEMSIHLYGKQDWKRIAGNILDRSPIQCLHRWSQVLRPGIKRGPWSKKEDTKLLKWIQTNGENNWYEAANFLKGRTAKQCKERWNNHLDPELKKGDWSFCEDAILFTYYKEFGPMWNKISEVLPSRTRNAAKRRFRINVRKLEGGEFGSDSIAKAIIKFEKIAAELKFENQKNEKQDLKNKNFSFLKNDLFFENFLAQQGNTISLLDEKEYDEFKELDNIQNSILSFCKNNIYPTLQDSLNKENVENSQEKEIKQKKIQRIKPPKNTENIDPSEIFHEQNIENITISMAFQDNENIKSQSMINEEDNSQINMLLGQLSSLEGLLKTAKTQLFELKNMDNVDKDEEQLRKLSEINMKRKLDLEDLSQNFNSELEKIVKKIKD